MAGDWKQRTLAELTENFDGQRVPVKESERKPGPYPYYGASGIVDHVDKFIFDGDYLLIAEDGENLRTQKTPIAFLARGKFWVNNHAHIVTGNAQSNTRFLMYALNNADIHGYLTGSTMPKLTQGNMNRIPILAPPPDEQHSIASILGALDDKIELNRRMDKTLEALAQTIFKSWFVDTTATKLPKGWREGPILELAKLLSGGTPKTDRKEYWDGNILWASAKDVSQCGQAFLVATERTITQKGLAESATQMIPALCTVVVARGATTGRMVLLGREMAMNQTCYALASTTGTPFALYCMLRHEMDELVHTAHGSVFDTITTSTFASSKIVLPPMTKLREFEESVSPIFRRILANIKESHTLAELRDALLPKLLSGELRVPRMPDVV
ncbi:MAG TPA: restriction endonuclease subunit S [Verrucomicrobiae bacterium]|jgi:type I restriction enzyme S subunit|nr:restriction endonuclease subunit S [Verrucomicrobiae bacterium]